MLLNKVQSALFRPLFRVLITLALAACATLEPATEVPAPADVMRAPAPSKDVVPAEPTQPDTPPVSTEAQRALPPSLVPAEWAELPNWNDDDHASALKAFLQSCEALGSRADWRQVCAAARKVSLHRVGVARHFFTDKFRPFRVLNADGTGEGVITGYYEPLLSGSRKPSSRYRYPIYGVPEDLLVVDLAELHPDLKGMRLRGRLDGRRIIPYYSRAQIEAGNAAHSADVLFWVDDPIDLFFLQVQGSGQIRLDSGARARVGYADQNGHPYRSIGRLLIERGELTLEQASMQGIKAWARANPEKLTEVLEHNASYVFFRELASNLPGPLGALGVPITAGRSLAVDRRFVPLGAPVYLATTWPNSRQPLRRLMMAQDTGAAIRGGVRGDYFWGFGERAGILAGRMRQSGRMWILAPNGVSPESLLAH
jgi:membrane-bound lytic murein transglycosylase A